MCLDLDWRPEFRTALIPTYKAHRVAVEDGAPDATGTGGTVDVEEVPDTLTPQVDMIMDVLAAAGGDRDLRRGRLRGRDVIGTLAWAEAQDPVIVVSGDRDLLQVVSDDPVPVRVLYGGARSGEGRDDGPGRGRREVRCAR